MTSHMAHPFEKMLTAALKKSTSEENLVLKEATKLLDKGYRPEEIHGVLSNMSRGLIDSGEEAIINDAIEELSGRLGIADDDLEDIN
jgi:hypothetical protein